MTFGVLRGRSWQCPARGPAARAHKGLVVVYRTQPYREGREQKQLARAHRQLGEAEHAVERRMLAQADNVPDPEHMSERAHRLSESADRHLDDAERLERAARAPTGPEVT